MVSGKIGQARDKEGSVSFQNSLRGDRLLVLVDMLRVLDGSVTDRIQEGICLLYTSSCRNRLTT